MGNRDQAFKDKALMKNLKVLTMVLLTTVLSVGCDLGVDSGNTSDDRHAEKVRNIEKSYDPLVGTYSGEAEVQTSGGPARHSLQMFVQVRRVPDGNYENGEVKYKPVLLGYFRLRGIVLDTDYQSFSGSVDGNKIFLSFIPTNGSGKSVWIDMIRSWNSTNTLTLKGEVTNEAGRVASFEVTHQGREVQRPIDEVRDLRERLEAMYAPLLGTYGNRHGQGPHCRGKAFPLPSRQGRSRCLNLRIYTELEEAETGLGMQKVPVLKANFDFTDKAFDVLALGPVDYNPFNGELIFISSSVKPGGGGAAEMRATGQLTPRGVVFDHIYDFNGREWLRYEGQRRQTRR